MSRKKHNRKRRRYKPYEQVKMKFFSMPDPFGDAPREIRMQALREVAANAKATFKRAFPRVSEWFHRYDPLYVLSFCLFYFLTAERGVDKEAIDGKIDFGSHHLELLQAIALMKPRGGTPEPLKDRAEELQQSLKELTEALNYSGFDLPENISEAETKKRFVLWQMRTQTLAIRNWAFPAQAIAHMKAFCSGPFTTIIAERYRGLSATRLIDTLVNMSTEIEERMNAHLLKLAPVMKSETFETARSSYLESFPNVEDDTDGMRRVFEQLCGGDLRQFKMILIMHAELRLPDMFTFTLDEVMMCYGMPEHRDAISQILERWSYRFGDLGASDPNHFLYSNPVLQRPFIAVDNELYFWVLPGILAHTLPGLIEGIVPPERRTQYLDYRSQYLEDTVEQLCRKAFPDGKVYRGSQWRVSENDPTLYENDILVIIDSTALVIECKAHLIDPPARRGAEFRLIDTLEDVVVSSSIQANRFVRFLREHPEMHSFKTRHGTVNHVDPSRLLRFVPFSVTYENLGYISANLKDSVEAGLIDSPHPLIPSLCITDLEIAFELLNSQSERIHYLSRRAEVERTTRYLGDESDLLAFYLESGFNIGEWENGNVALHLNMKSKELDPYFVARADGVSVPKPHLELSPLWQEMLQRIEQVKMNFWTEIAYVLLNVGRKDQDKFEREVMKLIKRVRSGKVTQKHNWIVMLNHGGKDRKYAVIGFPYRVATREERDDMMRHIAGELEERTPVLGMVIVGINVDVLTYPYDVMAYVPGHAPGAPDFDGVLERGEAGSSGPEKPAS